MKPTFFSTRTLCALLLCILSSLLTAGPGNADEGEACRGAEETMDFADALFHRGTLYRATMEYNRFLYFYSAHPESHKAQLNIATAAKEVGDYSSDPVLAQEEEEKSQLGFADHLFNRGHYYQAVTEYERFIYFKPDHPSIPEARLKIASCYERGEQYDRAIELFRILAAEYHDNDVGKEAAYNVGKCFLLDRDYEQALIEFNRFIKDHPDAPLADKAQWNSAWTAIYLEDYASAQEHLFRVRESSDYQQPSRELASALEQLPQLPHKSPYLAGFLAAVIPGAGHLYTGKKKQALFAFFTNALLAFGTYEAFSNNLYTAGGFLSLFTLNYYSGNIFGALNSTHTYNKKVTDDYLEQFRHKYELSINPLLGFTVHY